MIRELVRRSVDNYLFKHPYWTEYNGVKVKVCCMTDIPAKARLRDGLGYINDWVLQEQPRVLCDVGCNIGLFPLWIYAHTGTRVRGMFVDASYQMVDKCRENLAVNGWDLHKSRFVTGLVGENEGTKFFANASHQASSCHVKPKNGGVAICPPVLDIAEAWGNQEGDMLKVDIEGSEMGLIMNTPAAFFLKFKRIIIEYHEPLCSVSLLRYLMPSQFKFVAVTGIVCGNTYWERR